MNMKPRIIHAIQAIVPNAEVTINDNDINKITWLDSRTKPTNDAIKEKLAELQADYDSKSYARARQQNFPNEHDLLIALWEKVMEDRSESADALQVIRTQVKSDNPKPE